MTGVSGGHLTALNVLQGALARLYQVEPAQDVAPFVVDDEGLQALAECGAIQPRRGAREEVFVLDDGHEVSLALYLDERAREAVLDAVRGEQVTLSPERFNDFCVALEGVSHFLLMSHRAEHERTVTELELELQAEVDKYVMARLCPWEDSRTLSLDGEEPRVTASATVEAGAPPPEQLEHAIFDAWSLAEHLRSEQAERYVTASRLAHRFCRMIEQRFLRHGRADGMLRALRDFYRRTQTERLQLIAALG